MFRLMIASLLAAPGAALADNAVPLPPGAVARLGTPRATTDGLASQAVSPDGKRIAAGGFDGVIRVWDRASGKELHRFKENGWVIALAFSPDGKLLAGRRLWELSSGQPVPHWQPRSATLRAVAFSPDGRRLAVTYDDRVSQVLDPATGKEVLRLPDDLDWITALAFSPDGKRLAVAGFGPDAFRLYDSAGGAELLHFNKHTDWVYGLAFSPDGRLLFSASADRTARIWDVDSVEEYGPRLQDAGARLLSADWSPDGSLVAAGTADHAVILWEPLSGQVVRRFEGHGGDVRGVAFLPDSRTLVSASTDGTVLLWDVTGWSTEKPRKLSDDQLEQLWLDLAGGAGPAHRAKWQLIAAPEQSVPFLADRIKALELGRIPKLVAELDADQFDVRENAMTELEKLGALAEPALRKAQATKPSLEMTRRIEDLLKRSAGKAGNRLQVLRAIGALEHIDTPAARKVMEGLGK